MQLSLRKFVKPASGDVVWLLERSDKPGGALVLSGNVLGGTGVITEEQYCLLHFLGLIDRKNGEWILEERSVLVAELVDALASGASGEIRAGSSPALDTVVRRCCP